MTYHWNEWTGLEIVILRNGKEIPRHTLSLEDLVRQMGIDRARQMIPELRLN